MPDLPPTPTAPLRLLRIVAAVAEQGSATRAALALHLSVSAVARAVQQAEALLGVALFERCARGMVVTEQGRALSTRTQRALGELRLGAGEALASRATDAMLQALQAVATTRSESAAAARLGLAQPSVHVSLRQLEHVARLRLLERSRHGTRLTDAGERVLQRVCLALAELRSGHDELAALLGGRRSQVAVGALPMTAELLVPQALLHLLASRPGLQVTVLDGTYEALVHRLRHGEVDLVVGPLRGPSRPPDIEEQVLVVDRLLPVVRSGHPVRAGRGPRSLRGLSRWPWVAPLAGTPARAAFERIFQSAGLALPTAQLQANSPSILRSVLQGSDAVALVSPMQVHAELASGQLVALTVPMAGTERDIGVSLRRNSLPSASARAMLESLQHVAATADGGLGTLGSSGPARGP